MKREKLFLIDSNALIHRAFHALPPLSSQKGELTNAVYGFTSLLIKAINEIKPEYIIAAFDLPEPTFRHKEFEEYKAHRKSTPEDLVPQFEKVKEVLRAFNIPIFEKAGFEADDLLGTITLLSKDKNPDIENIVLTGDLDTLQLVDNNTIIYTLKKGISDIIIYDEKAVVERYGLDPSQMVDFKALKGDPSDNIPGVPGFGDKTASKLLSEYKTLENIYENIALIPKKLSDKLTEYKDQAFFSKRLATIIRDVDIDFDFKKARFGDYDKKNVLELFRELNFFTLISRLNLKVENREKEEIYSTANVEVFKKIDLDLIKKIESIAISIFDETVLFSFDSKFISASFDDAKVILEDEKIKKIGFDFKIIIKKLRERDIFLKGEYFDVMIASYLLSPGLRSYNLKNIILEHLGKDISEEDVKNEEAYFCFLLKEILENKLKQNNILNIFFDVEMPLIHILADMEMTGIGVNPDKLNILSEKLEKKLKILEKNIYDFSGKVFNINSPSQLGIILFEDLRIQNEAKIKKTKTGAYSTNESELEKFKENHKIVNEVLNYREFFKLKTTYSDALSELINKKTGRIHTTFNQAGTTTGRLSSSDPNMQNIPQKGEFSSDIREAFVSQEGYSFVAFDYSQIELRIIAHLSGDEKMIKIFNEGGDIHIATAMEINNVSERDVTKEMRRMAKVLNFGILFGMSIKGFSVAADVDMTTAKVFIDGYFNNFKKVSKFIEDSICYAKIHGYAKTELGRKRWLPDLKSPNWILRNSAERMAQNMPVQGLEADILKLAMIEIDKNILQKQTKDSIRMILQVHDELVFEIKNDIINDIAIKIKDVMILAYELKVPMLVGVSKGDSWGEMRIL
ncbi:MAG: DNA polymerase I [Patescibacteria group bacterium]